MKNIENKLLKKKATLNELVKDPNNRDVLRKWYETELAYTTSNGIRGGIPWCKTIVAIKENKRHEEALTFTMNQVNSNTINVEVISQIHKHILYGADDTNADSYRSQKIRVIGSKVAFPPPENVPELMEEFDRWLTTTDEDIISKAINAHYRLVAIHPFANGNGRTARLLMDLILMQDGFSPVIINNRNRYFNSLEKYSTIGDEKSYHKFMLSALNRTMNAAISMLVINQPNSTNAKLINISKHIKAKAVLASYTYTKATNVFFSNMYLVAKTVYRCAKEQGVYRCATALIETFHCH